MSHKRGKEPLPDFPHQIDYIRSPFYSLVSFRACDSSSFSTFQIIFFLLLSNNEWSVYSVFSRILFLLSGTNRQLTSHTQNISGFFFQILISSNLNCSLLSRGNRLSHNFHLVFVVVLFVYPQFHTREKNTVSTNRVCWSATAASAENWKYRNERNEKK